MKHTHTQKLLEAFIDQLVSEVLNEADPPPVPPQARKGPPPVPQQAAQPRRSAGTGQNEPVSLTPLGGKWETGNLEQDAQKVLDVNKDKLAKKGINVAQLKKLGVGTMGVAYDMGDKVLKVTKDAKEAKTSGIVAGKDVPNIVHVYDIWQFPGVDWYGLIIEKLKPLSKEEETELTNAVVNTKFPLLLHQANDDWNVAMRSLARETMNTAVAQAFKQYPDAQQGAGVSDPRVQAYIRPIVQKKIADFDKVTKEFNMRGLFKSLKSLGIQYYDFHGGNYGRRADGTIVLFDLGRSISKGAMPPQLQEAYNRIKIALLS